MAEWIVEQGIGEDRAALIEGDTIVAAQLCWREALRAGAVVQARLDHRHPGTRRGAVHLPDGTIALIDALTPQMTGGARLMVRITRAALAEQGRFKLAQCRPAGDVPAAPAPTLAQAVAQTGHSVRVAGMLDRSLDRAGWPDLVEQAASGVVDFPGGRLTISPTPAMTLIDIDGPPPLAPLAQAAARAVPETLARLDIAGSVGIDFPGQETRADRQAIDAVLDTALAAQGWQGERTAMNGFGLVQLISRLERPSLVARMAFHPARAAACALLRAAERVAEPGALLLTAHPAVLGAIDAAMQAELARRSGREIRRAPREHLALHAGFAQAIAP